MEVDMTKPATAGALLLACLSIPCAASAQAGRTSFEARIGATFPAGEFKDNGLETGLALGADLMYSLSPAAQLLQAALLGSLVLFQQLQWLIVGQRVHCCGTHADPDTQGCGIIIGTHDPLPGQYRHRLCLAAAQALQGQLVEAQAQPEAHRLSRGRGPLYRGAGMPIINIILYINTVLLIPQVLSSRV
jgi:hypothetical protein